jgi:hypothetical protein
MNDGEILPLIPTGELTQLDKAGLADLDGQLMNNDQASVRPLLHSPRSLR